MLNATVALGARIPRAAGQRPRSHLRRGLLWRSAQGLSALIFLRSFSASERFGSVPTTARSQEP
jgi:hypothetical protein